MPPAPCASERRRSPETVPFPASDRSSLRKTILNGLVWVAKRQVPARRVESNITVTDLDAHLDPKPQKAK